MPSRPTIETTPPSPESLGRDRALSAPELAAALGRATSGHGPELKHGRTPSLQAHHHSRIDSTPELIEKLDDLGPDDATAQSPTSTRLAFPTTTAWRTYFMQEVAGDKFLELQLLLMTVATGIIDAMTYSTYRVFASKQTGNTLFLALHAFSSPSLAPLTERKVGVSMGVFIAGAAFFGHIGHLTRQRRRIWLLASNAFQALLILAAAAVRYWSDRTANGPGALGILALLSFAESGQIANALSVAMPELNTTMITGALIQLCTDPKIFARRNAKRDRRLAFFVSMLLGCFIGASILRYSSPSAALVVVASAKGGLFGSFFFNRGLVERTCRDEEAGRDRVEGTVTPVSRVLWGD